MSRLSPVSYKQLVKVFEADGFRCVRTEGDHMVFTKPGVSRPVVIPKYAAVAGVRHQEQFPDSRHFPRPLLRTAGRVSPSRTSLIFKMYTMTTLTLKITSLYVAYAPEFDVSAYGGCRDEALNNLADEIRQRQGEGELTGDKRN